MFRDCPDPKEIADFHFRQLRTLSVIDDNRSTVSKPLNLLGSASKYGLLFIGVEGGFKVIKLEDVLTCDEEKENRGIEKNYPYCFVACGTPVLLSVNSSQTILAVCVQTVSGTSIYLYNLLNFQDSGSAWQPFCCNGVAEVQDFAWNPTIEGLYTLCLSDGSLHIHEVSGGTSVKAVASLQAAGALSVCWSPKGKQLVVGKVNGTFSQYKPTLQEVKTVAAPQLEEGPLSVTSICWISTTIFAVVYVADGVPNLFIVSTPKDSPVVYTNFNDVCLGNNSAPLQKYFLQLEPQWGILICASLDSIEIAVLGDMPNWVQWDLREDGKALLPGKDGATHAIGMTVMYSAQKQIIISESESYSPMPVMFLLTNNGLLVSFHMINTRPGAPALVSAPLPIELKNFSIVDAMPQQLPSSLGQLPMPSAFVSEKVPAGNEKTSHLQGHVEHSSMNISSASTGIVKESEIPQSIHALNKRERVTTMDSSQKVPEQHKPSSSFFVEKKNEIQTSADHSYRMAIISEIQNFSKEMLDLKQLQNSMPAMSGEKDMALLKTLSSNMQNFQKDVLETMQSISSDVFTLKNVVLESFMMLEEARSRERRQNDHSYVSLLKGRALDPTTARWMQGMEQRIQYIKMQLQEVSNRLDQEWIALVSSADRKKKSMRSNSCISSTEAIYKTIVNNQNIIHNLKKKVDILSERSEERKLNNTTKRGSRGRYHRRLMQEDLSKLADEFLQAKITQPDEEPVRTKKLTQESQNFLKSFLKESSVVTVRPTAIYSPSQSRLISNAIVCENTPLGIREKENLSENISASPPPAVKPINYLEVTPVKPVSEVPAPVYEPITPPEAGNTLQTMDKTFTFSNAGMSPSTISYHQPSSSLTIEPIVTSVSPSTIVSIASSSPVVTIASSSDQSGKPSVSTTTEHNKGFLSFSSAGSKHPTSEWAFPKPASSAPSSFVFPKLSFASSIAPSSESTTFKPLTTIISNSTTSGEKTNLVQRPTATDTVQKPKPSVISEGPLQSTVQKVPVATSSATVSSSVSQDQNSNFGLSVSFMATSSTSMPPLGTASKNSILFDGSQTPLFFQKSSDATSHSFSLDKCEGSVLSRTPEETVNLSSNAIDKIISPLPSTQEQKNDAQKLSFGSPTNNLVSSEAPSITAIFTLTCSQGTMQVTTISESVAPSKNSNSLNAPSSKPSVGFSSVSSASIAAPPANVNSSTSSDKGVLDSSPVTVSSAVTTVSNTTSPLTTISQELLSPTTTICSPVVSEKSPDVGKKPEAGDALESTAAATTAVFGTNPPLFGKPSSEVSAPLFGAATTVPSSGTATATAAVTANIAPAFNQAVSDPAQSSAFGHSTSGGFFSQAPSFGAGLTTATTTAANSNLGNTQSTAFSFGKPAFGQPSGTFGLAKSFSQNATPFTEAGTPSSFSFGQNSNVLFGQGAFFSGLGGKPSEENASKNVFGLNNNVKPAETSNLFRNSGISAFGASPTSQSSFSGHFSSGGGSVAQSGFGAFQQQPQQSAVQQPTGGFGGTPAFGGSPAFGGTPGFGSSPTFGSGGSLSSIFNQQQQVSSNFSNFANASSPTFGSLASQGSGGFSSPPAGGGGFSAPPVGGGFSSPAGGGFGSQASPAFGGSSTFGSPSFGQSSGFGSPSSPSSNTSAFTQWRS